VAGVLSLAAPLTCWQMKGRLLYRCVVWQSPAGLKAIFHCLRFETPPQLGGPGSRIYTPRHWVPFSSHLNTRRAGLWWRYSNKPPPGSELLYDWRFTANQFVLAPRHLRITTQFFFFLQLNPCCHSPYVHIFPPSTLPRSSNSLGVDPKKNTASNNSSIVASASVAAETCCRAIS
jgi:hypothetical protein